MAIKHYSWKSGPDEIQQHSIAKHKILQSYLSAYFQTLVGSGQPRDEFKLTLVDGFAGGGLYYHADTRELVKGSPFILLNAEREAEFEINRTRTKPVRLDISHFFIEANRHAHLHLRKVLEEEGHGFRIGKNIFVRHGLFQEEAAAIIEFIKKKTPRNGRSIFILDQFGYTAVPKSLINTILSSLPSAEIILTFGVDSLLNYADERNFQYGLKQIEIPNCLGDRTFSEIKQSDRDWRLFIQSALYKELVTDCGAQHYTPFFIRNRKGHGDYWLLHLSQHHKARDVMTAVHWKNQNDFIHYAGAGLDMFNMIGYDPTYDDEHKGQGRLGFEFDDLARSRSVAALKEQIPEIVYGTNDGMTYERLYADTCNLSPAYSAIYQQALFELSAGGILRIVGKDGSLRRSAARIGPSDLISQPNQRRLFLF